MKVTGSGSAPIPLREQQASVRASRCFLLLIVAIFAMGLGLGTRAAVIEGAALGSWAVAAAILFLVAVFAATRLHARFVGKRPTKLVPVDDGETFPLTLWADHLILGRNACCDIVLNSAAVSGHHCRIYSVGQAVVVEDLNSRNGVFVNGRRVRKRRLREGDRVAIADREYIVS